MRIMLYWPEIIAENPVWFIYDAEYDRIVKTCDFVDVLGVWLWCTSAVLNRMFSMRFMSYKIACFNNAIIIQQRIWITLGFVRLSLALTAWKAQRISNMFGVRWSIGEYNVYTIYLCSLVEGTSTSQFVFNATQLASLPALRLQNCKQCPECVCF